MEQRFIIIMFVFCLFFSCKEKNAKKDVIFELKDFMLDYKAFSSKYDVPDSIFWDGKLLLQKVLIYNSLEGVTENLSQISYEINKAKNRQKSNLAKSKYKPESIQINIKKDIDNIAQNQDFFYFEVELKNISEKEVHIDEYTVSFRDPLNLILYYATYKPSEFPNSVVTLLPSEKKVVKSRMSIKYLNEIVNTWGINLVGNKEEIDFFSRLNISINMLEYKNEKIE